MGIPFDSCDNCQEDYELDPVKDILFVFMNEPQHNHVLALCPNCGTYTRIFLIPDTIMGIMSETPLPLHLGMAANPDISERYSSLSERVEKKRDLPELPRTMAMELDRDIHRFMYGAD